MQQSDIKNGKCSDIALGGSKLLKAFGGVHIERLVSIVFPEDERANDGVEVVGNVTIQKPTYDKFMQLFTCYNDFYALVKFNPKETVVSEAEKDERYAKLLQSNQVFRECFVSMFPADKITNYLHYIISGHVLDMYEKCGFLGQYSQVLLKII